MSTVQRVNRLRLQACAIAAILIVTVVAVGILWRWGQCELYGHATGRDVRVSPFVGCMVKTGEHWIPRSELRTVNE